MGIGGFWVPDVQTSENRARCLQGGPSRGGGLWGEAHRGGERGGVGAGPSRGGASTQRDAVAAGRGDGPEVQHEPGQHRGQRQQGKNRGAGHRAPSWLGMESILPQADKFGYFQVIVSFYAEGGQPIDQAGVFLTGIGE